MSELILTQPTPNHYFIDLELPLPPTEDDLPYDDGIPMETTRHRAQAALLTDTLMLAWNDRDNFHVAMNSYVYFSPTQEKTYDYKGPDVYVVLDVPRRERKSWLVWQEGKGPDVIIELLSPSTAKRDKTVKKQIYQDRLRVPEYFWYDPYTAESVGFILRDGVYRPIKPDAQGRLISTKLQLALVHWYGQYADIEARWLRWATLEGELLPTAEEWAWQEHELAEQAREQAEQAQAQAEQAQAQAIHAEQHAQKLESLLARYRAQFGELPH